MKSKITPTIAALSLLVLVSCSGNHKTPNPSGTLEAVETDIAPAIAGRILTVGAQLGDTVTTGDTLLVLDTELIQLQRAQSEAGRLSIAAQRKVAEESIAQAERNRQWLDTTRSRTEALVQQGSATQNQLDELQTRYDVAAHQVAVARDQLQVLAAEEARLEAALAVFDRQLKEGVVIAPTDGAVLLRSVEPGEVIQPGSVCLKIADLSALELRIYLAETDLDRVKIGGHLKVLIDALPGEPREGEVIWVSPESEFTPKNAQTRDARTQLVYAVKLRVVNPDRRLHIGMPAEVVI
jgi:HlyD family secretion protein